MGPLARAQAVKPPVLHGAGGVSRKGPGTDEYSRYVSITRLTAAGTMRGASAEIPLSGTAWFDHEWGPGVLPAGAAGWDWFALQLDDGSDLMLYRMRADGRPGDAVFLGNVRSRDGRAAVPGAGTTSSSRRPRCWTSPRSGARYPARWRIAVAPLGLDVRSSRSSPTRSSSPRSRPASRTGRARAACGARAAARPSPGRAYAELTGYAGRDVPGFAGAPLTPVGVGFGVDFVLALPLVSSVTRKLFALVEIAVDVGERDRELLALPLVRARRPCSPVAGRDMFPFASKTAIATPTS